MLKVILLADTIKAATDSLFTLTEGKLTKLTDTMYLEKDSYTRYLLFSQEDEHKLKIQDDTDQIIVVGIVPHITRYVLNNVVQKSCVPREFKIQYVSL